MGRVGGDEFVAFAPDFTSEEEIGTLCTNLNTQLTDRAKELMGPDMEIPLGVSIGAIYVCGEEADYTDALSLADKALYSVKQKDKHGFAMFKDDETDDDSSANTTGLKALSMMLSERARLLSCRRRIFSSMVWWLMR